MALFDRLRAGLGRSRDALSQSIGNLFRSGRLTPTDIETLEEILLTADLGLAATDLVIAKMKARKLDQFDDPAQFRNAIAEDIAEILKPSAQPLSLPGTGTAVILMAGVNGAGKTTTIGKLAQRFKQNGQRVMLAAGDTFRAAAVEQLEIWGQRVDIPVITTRPGGDAAGLAFSALEQARQQNMDILIIDTAGRLQTNEGLMAELEKIIRVIRKLDPDAPHASLLVLDATTGQNAVQQARAFQDAANITGLIMTKLDGTARGGVLVAITQSLGLPIHFIGVGEGVEDLQEFDPMDFARALTGAENPTDINLDHSTLPISPSAGDRP